MRSHRSWWLGWLGGLAALAGLSSPASAQDVPTPAGWDEPWFFAGDLGATFPLNDPLDDQFDPGGDLGLSVYRSVLPEIAFGAQLRFGLLGEGEIVPQDPIDRGLLDYQMLTANIRVRPLAMLQEDDRRATGLFLEAGAGGSLLDGDVVPAFNAAIGYGFGLGPISLAPKIRFTHFIETENRFGDTDVLTLTGAIEVAFLDQAEPVSAAAEMEASFDEGLALREDEELELEAEQLEADELEARQAERLAEDPFEDGVDIEDPNLMINDALVVEERVFFDFDEADLRDEGMRYLDAVVEHYRQYGGRYQSLVVSGHADRRGPVPYNEDLSRRRAAAVVDYLVANGVPQDVLDVRAYGELRPEVLDAETPLAHQINRRVEFEVEWAEGQRPPGIRPEPDPVMPEVVDLAPPAVREREDDPAVQAREGREREQVVAELDRAAEEERLALAEDERQRLAVAEELLSYPQVLFEP